MVSGFLWDPNSPLAISGFPSLYHCCFAHHKLFQCFYLTFCILHLSHAQSSTCPGPTLAPALGAAMRRAIILVFADVLDLVLLFRHFCQVSSSLGKNG